MARAFETTIHRSWRRYVPSLHAYRSMRGMRRPLKPTPGFVSVPSALMAVLLTPSLGNTISRSAPGGDVCLLGCFQVVARRWLKISSGSKARPR